MISCQFENGSKANLRHVTVNAIIIKDGKVLLGKRGTFKGKPILESGKWALIGGFFDRDENLTQAVKREVREETGWEIDNLQLLRINDSPKRPMEDRQNVDMIFLAEAVKQNKIESEEVKELEWFNLNNLPVKEQIAFDHGEDIELYKKYLQEKFPIPVLG
jgi:ADP-ribose pyrophosphatase YjhB (NUDIX family)